MINFRNHRMSENIELLFPPTRLESAYNFITKELNRRYLTRLESVRTGAEYQVLRKIKNHVSVRCQKSIWIGRRNVDLFFPQLLNGLVIEVDGDVHFRISNMRRDTSKLNALDFLGIKTIVIQNHAITNQTFLNIIHWIASLRPGDTRKKQRVLRNIQLKTILDNFQAIDLSQTLPQKSIYALTELKRHFDHAEYVFLGGHK